MNCPAKIVRPQAKLDALKLDEPIDRRMVAFAAAIARLKARDAEPRNG